MVEERTEPSSRVSDARTAPGPKGASRLRLLWRFLTAGDRVSETLNPPLLLTLKDEYGPVARIRTPFGADVYLVSDPGHVEYVLKSNRENFRKNPAQVSELKKLFGDGLVTIDGERWRRHKRLLAPLFTGRRGESGASVATGETRKLLDEWEASTDAIDLDSDTFELTYDILGRTIFGEDFARYRADVLTALEVNAVTFPRESSPLPTGPEWLPTPHNRRMNEVRSSLNRAVEALVERRRNDPGAHDDVTSDLLAVADGELNDGEVRDELKTMLIAGLVTSSALFWTLYSLAAHPDVQRTLAEGLQAGNGSDYLEQVIHETLRLYPPLPPAIRTPVHSDVIGGFEIPAGAHVLINQASIHRDPEIWPDPLTFRPTRFDDGWADRKSKYSYYPFGGGVRTCIGREFAYAILTATVTEVVSRYRLRLGDDHERVVTRPATWSRDVSLSVDRRTDG